MIKSLADTFDVSQYKMKPEYNKRKEKVIKKINKKIYLNKQQNQIKI